MTANGSSSSHSRNVRLCLWVARLLTALTTLYCMGVCGWVILHLFFGDRWRWLFLLNSFALYLFAPLPLLLVLALLMHRRAIWIGFSAVLALGVYFYGGLLLPKFSPGALTGPTITVMTYNAFGLNEQTAQVVSTLQASDADVIALQELNPPLAEAIRRDLTVKYPYQVLDPQPGVVGMGVLSRYPLHPNDVVLQGGWVGTPQVLDLAFGNTTITLLNFHAIPPEASFPHPMLHASSTHERERQAQEIAAFASTHPSPLIVLGDLNATDRSTAYAIISRSLRDTWRVTGWGFGHTYRLDHAYLKIPIPLWLVRIDYVFCSDDWQPAAAWIGPWDGHADHRPVVATLALICDVSKGD